MFLVFALSSILQLYMSLWMDPSFVVKCTGCGDVRTGFFSLPLVLSALLSCLAGPVLRGQLMSEGGRGKELTLILALAASSSKPSQAVHQWNILYETHMS